VLLHERLGAPRLTADTAREHEGVLVLALDALMADTADAEMAKLAKAPAAGFSVTRLPRA
jgi:hypothetical protein